MQRLTETSKITELCSRLESKQELRGRKRQNQLEHENGKISVESSLFMCSLSNVNCCRALLE